MTMLDISSKASIEVSNKMTQFEHLETNNRSACMYFF